MHSHVWNVVSLVLAAAASPQQSAQQGAAMAAAGTVEVWRDTRGVPHVYAPTDEGAYFGLGYATAQDRFCQMTLNRLLIYGRVSEFFGADQSTGDALYLDHDRTMRLCGYRRLAKRLFNNLAPEGKRLLEAYADGVNRYVFPQGGAQPVLHDFFSVGVASAQLGAQVVLEAEPWEPWDSIALWLRISRLYADAEVGALAEKLHTYEAWVASGGLLTIGSAPSGGDQDLFRQLFPPRIFTPNSAPVPQTFDPLLVARVDDGAAQAWLDAQPCPPAPFGAQPFGAGRVYYNGSFARAQYAHGPDLGDAIDKDPDLAGEQSGGAFSHAWAVAGDGASRPATLMGDPRIEVRAPNELYEASLDGATFRVRGACIPGTANFVVGSNGMVAWSPTALSMQQADLFELTTDESTQPDRFQLDGAWTDMLVVPDSIAIREPGGTVANEAIDYRETTWGPVLTRASGDTLVVGDCQPDEQFSVRWIPLELMSKDPSLGFVGLYRAVDADDLLERVGAWNEVGESGWTWPGVHLVFADAAGRAGYTVTGALPLRSCKSILGGAIAQDGSTSLSAWASIVPPQFLPWVVKQPHASVVQHVHSANHTPVDADDGVTPWYPIPLVNRGGDTPRSRRLRELLGELGFGGSTVAQSFAIHEDATWTHGRDIVLAGFFLRDVQGWTLDAASLELLDELEWTAGESWASAGGGGGVIGADDPTTSPDEGKQSCIARLIGLSSAFRWDQAPDLVATYGVGDYGLSHLLGALRAKLELPGATLTPDEADFIDLSLKKASEKLIAIAGQDPNQWSAWFEQNHLTKSIASFDPLEHGFASLDPATTTVVGPVKAAFAHTLLSQLAQTYSQWIELVAPGQCIEESLLALGQSELEGSPHHLDQLDDWATTFGEVQAFLPSPIDKASVSTILESKTVIPYRQRSKSKHP